MPAGYLTYGRSVFLSRASKRVRMNAKSAGLKPVSARMMGKLIRRASAVGRMLHEGMWYDTVKY